jgi:hypothetical protein
MEQANRSFFLFPDVNRIPVDIRNLGTTTSYNSAKLTFIKVQIGRHCDYRTLRESSKEYFTRRSKSFYLCSDQGTYYFHTFLYLFLVVMFIEEILRVRNAFFCIWSIFVIHIVPRVHLRVVINRYFPYWGRGQDDLAPIWKFKQ